MVVVLLRRGGALGPWDGSDQCPRGEVRQWGHGGAPWRVGRREVAGEDAKMAVMRLQHAQGAMQWTKPRGEVR